MMEKVSGGIFFLRVEPYGAVPKPDRCNRFGKGRKRWPAESFWLSIRRQTAGVVLSRRQADSALFCNAQEKNPP